LSLWQRTSVFDARAVLGYYCYRAGDYQDAVRVWLRIPRRNLEVRPEIAALLLDAQHRAALQADGELGLPFPESPAVPFAMPDPVAGSWPLVAAPAGFAPSVPLSTPLSLTLDTSASVSAPPYFEPPIMLNGASAPAYVEPPATANSASEPPLAAAVEPDFAAQSLPVALPPEVTGPVAETPLPLWSATNWATARGAEDVPAVDE
jgi:hypothetical protein